MRLLLIEADEVSARAIDLLCKAHGMQIDVTDLGEEGIARGKIYDYDAVVTELNLPDMAGFEVIRSMRVAKVQTPIMVISVMADPPQKVRAFGFGADDYLVKPFDRDEFVARLHALVRRSAGITVPVVEIGPLRISFADKSVFFADQRIHITRKEYEMLEAMALRPGHVVTKEAFMNHLYSGDDEPDAKIVDVFVHKLRKRLGIASGGANFIETIWGRGYALIDPYAKSSTEAA